MAHYPHRHHPKAPSHPNNHSHRPNYPNHPAPGGANYEDYMKERRGNRPPPRGKVPNRSVEESINQPEKKSRFERLREKFQKQPVTPEEVARLKLESEKERYKYDKKYYRHSQRQLGSSFFGGGQIVAKRPVGRPPFRQQTGSMGNSILGNGFGNGPVFGGLDSAFGLSSSKAEQKRPVGRPKMQSTQKKQFGSGLNDLFGI